LNALLRFSNENIGLLNNGAFEKLLDSVYYAIFAKKERPRRDDIFHAVADRQGLITAQEGLAQWLPVLKAGALAHFPLSAHEVELQGNEGFARTHLPPGYPHWIKQPPEYFGTMIYTSFVNLFVSSNIKPSDLQICPTVSAAGILYLYGKQQKANVHSVRVVALIS